MAIDNAEKPTGFHEKRTSYEMDPSIIKERELIAKDPELNKLYEAILENFDNAELKRKSANQVKELTKRYYGEFSIFKIRERIRKKRKLLEFQTFADNLTPIRADENDFPVYKSPEQTGQVQSYGPQDILVKAGSFIYGSFKEIPHYMAKHNQKILDEEDIAPKSQIAFVDIANCPMRAQKGESYLKPYLTNLFDYENGKKILALYLASVFDTPEQAIEYIRQNNAPNHVQHWDNDLDGNQLKAMEELLKDTGLEPPLSLEIRVKDSAKQATS